MMKSILKKYILTCVSFAMLISLMHANPIHIHAEDVKSKTDAEIIVENYSLTSKEQSILTHDSINTTVYQYTEPTNDMANDLIEVDPDAFTIKAKSYSDPQRNQWIPEKVIIVENDVSKEYPLVNGKTSFTAKTDNYSVQVVYNCYVAMNKETQYRLLNTPYWLHNGFDAVHSLYTIANEFETLADYYLPILIKLRDGDGTPYGIKVTGDFATAVTNLKNQTDMNRYSTGYFNLNEQVAVYSSYRLNKRQEYYFSPNALKLKGDAIQMKWDLEAIAYSEGLQTILSVGRNMPGFESTVKALETLINYLEGLIFELEVCIENEDWEGRDYTLLSVTQGNTGLTSKVNASGKVNYHSMNEISNNVLLASKSIQCSVNRDRVNVIVEAYVVKDKNSSELIKLESEPVEIALKHEMSAVDVDKAVKEKVENEVLSKWSEEYQVCEDFYVRKTTNIGGKLTSDITYVVTYTPKDYNVVFSDNGDAPLTVPYGYELELPKAGNGMSYEYTINEEMYREGDYVRIVGDTTIERIIGKEKTVDRLLNLLSRDESYTLNDLHKSILTNDAVYSDIVEYRIVEPMDVNTTITYDETTREYSLVVNSYPSGINGMDWIPVSFKIVKGNTESSTVYSIKDGQATFKTDYFDSLNIAYELKVTKTENIRPVSVTNSYLLEQINIPVVLLEESKAQIESLDYLASFARTGGYLTMGTTIYSALTMLKSNYEDKYGKDLSLYPDHILKEYNAIVELRKECFNPDNGSHLYVYEYILKYMPKSMNEKAVGLGLIAYYHDEYGYEQYNKQLTLLVNNLSIVANSEEFNALLTGELASYKEKVTKLIEVLGTIKLVAPSKYININHPSISNLFDILDDNKSLNRIESVSGLTDRVIINKPQEGKVSVTLTLNVDGVNLGTTSVVFNVNTVLTQSDVNKIQNALEELYSKFDNKYYSKINAISIPKAGTRLTENIHLTESWSPAKYGVYVLNPLTNQKEKLQDITYNSTLLTLVKPSAGYRFDYEILGDVISVESSDVSYSITSEQFEQIAKDGELVITRRTYDLNKERLSQLFNGFNQSFNGLNSEFILTKNSDGQYIAILRVDPSESEEVQNQIVHFIASLTDSRFGYVAMGDVNQPLWDANAAKLSVQPYIQAMLNSGFNINTIFTLIDSNGNIAENVINHVGKNAEVVVGDKTDLSHLGGYLYETTLYLGKTSEDDSFVEVKYIVSIEDFDTQADYLKEVKSNMSLSQKVYSFNTENGKLNISYTLDDDTYHLIVSQMILSGYLKDEKVNDLTFSQLMSYFTQYSSLFESGDVTSTTVQNTLNSLGINIDLTNRVHLIDNLFNLNRNYGFVSGNELIENGGSGYLTYDIQPVINSLNIPEDVKVLFNTTTLEIPTTITVPNLGNSYEAIVYDYTQEAGQQMIFVESLETFDLGNEEVVIVLLKDIKHDLTLDTNCYLDLNGFRVSGNVDSIKKCLILDSTYSTGQVTGKLNGNIQVIGGSYSVMNINDYIVDGYEMKDGRVTPKFISIEQSDDKMIITVDPQMFYQSGETINALTKLMLVFTDFSKASVKVDDYVLYNPTYQSIHEFIEMNFDDIVNDSLDKMNYDQVSEFFNILLKEFTNMSQLSTNKEVTYQYVTNPYSLEFTYNKNKDVLEGNVKVSDSNNEKELVIRLKDDDAYENASTVLKDIYSINYESIQIEDFDFENGIEVEMSDVNAKVKINNNVEYTIMFGVILAYGTNDPQLIQAIKDYILNEKERSESREQLLSAIHNLTTKQIVDAIIKVSSMDVSYSNMSSTLKLPTYEHASKLDSVIFDYVDYLSTKLSAYGKTGNNELVKTHYTYFNFYEFDQLNVELNLVAELPCTHKKISEVVKIYPTCTEAGVYAMVCDECNEELETGSIEPKGHGTSSPAMNARPATCEQDGYTGDLVCDDCGEVTTQGEVIPKTEHEKVVVPNTAKEPTCMEEGYTGDEVCVKCGHVSTGTYFERTEHKYSNGICVHCNIKDPYYSPYPLGDVNGDNKVTSLDYVKIKNHIMGTKYLSSAELERADVSKDGSITSLDYIKIRKHIMGSEKLY